MQQEGELSGESIAEVFASAGVPLLRADNARILGWQRVREYLAAAEDGTPRLRIMANCENLIRTLPLLTFDEHNAEDVAGNAEDHAAEALRYGLMSRPVQARQPLRYDPFAVPKRQGSVFQGL